ncbi:hypothetical protein ROZALSC1DRAFT_22929 [Rozella allomycis CSF55]|uniref:RGS domain-containing protein n=1 Tax=Rozella allomycis (strain CSF55) TaxID=988480 RepID=A0A4P9YGV2_ROZAC|nr:hypothetical protein ROZALSC1DRAFT_22929 [Rozella allomycis CSF55]
MNEKDYINIFEPIKREVLRMVYQNTFPRYIQKQICKLFYITAKNLPQPQAYNLDDLMKQRIKSLIRIIEDNQEIDDASTPLLKALKNMTTFEFEKVEEKEVQERVTTTSENNVVQAVTTPSNPVASVEGLSGLFPAMVLAITAQSNDGSTAKSQPRTTGQRVNECIYCGDTNQYLNN